MTIYRIVHNHLCLQAGAYQNGMWVVAVAKAGCEEGCDLIGLPEIADDHRRGPVALHLLLGVLLQEGNIHRLGVWCCNLGRLLPNGAERQIGV